MTPRPKIMLITQKDIDQALRCVVRARIQLLVYQAFFGSMAMSLDPVNREEVGTMATDGRRLYFSAAFALTMPEQELVAVLAHEVMHVTGMHMTRRGLRDPTEWNICCDLAINVTLAEACLASQGSMVMPKCALLDQRYKDKSAEWIYDHREKTGQSKGKGQGQGKPGQGQGQGEPGQSPLDPGGMGGVIDAVDAKGNPLSEADRSILENDIKVGIFQAAMAAKNRGQLPACLERMVGELRKPVVDWREKLRRFWSAQFPSDYSLNRPNRRGVHAGLYLPSIVKDGVGEIVVAVDTSGSIGQTELAQFVGEINSIADEACPEVLHVISCDAKIQSHQTFMPGEAVDHHTLKMGGGGGTAFTPVFTYCEKKAIEPKCLIYLTDLYGDTPKDPGYPVLWVSTTPQLGPFGDTVQIEMGRV